MKYCFQPNETGNFVTFDVTTGQATQPEHQPHYNLLFLSVADALYRSHFVKDLAKTTQMMQETANRPKLTAEELEYERIKLDPSYIIVRVDDNYIEALKQKPDPSKLAIWPQRFREKLDNFSIETPMIEQEPIIESDEDPRIESEMTSPLAQVVAMELEQKEERQQYKQQKKSVKKLKEPKKEPKKDIKEPKKEFKRIQRPEKDISFTYNRKHCHIGAVVRLKPTAKAVKLNNVPVHRKVAIAEINVLSRYIVVRAIHQLITVSFDDIESVVLDAHKYNEEYLPEMRNMTAFRKNLNGYTMDNIHWRFNKQPLAEFQLNFATKQLDITVFRPKLYETQFRVMVERITKFLNANNAPYYGKMLTNNDKMLFIFTYLFDYLMYKQYFMYSFEDYIKAIKG